MQNGQEITTKLIKYGIERSFAPSLSGGLGYHKTLLEGGKNYQAPTTASTWTRSAPPTTTPLPSS